jgi:hypothetical protein
MQQFILSIDYLLDAAFDRDRSRNPSFTESNSWIIIGIELAKNKE